MTAAQIAREFTRLKRMQRDLRLEEEEHRDHPIAWQCRWLRWLVANRMQRLAKLMRYGAALLILCGPVLGQHQHPTGPIPKATGEFYENWMRPDMPQFSCCHQQDCAEAEVRTRDGKIEARQIGGEWFVVPQQKIEQNRDSPDGRNHLCVVGTSVLCFIFGNGT